MKLLREGDVVLGRRKRGRGREREQERERERRGRKRAGGRGRERGKEGVGEGEGIRGKRDYPSCIRQQLARARKLMGVSRTTTDRSDWHTTAIPQKAY